MTGVWVETLEPCVHETLTTQITALYCAAHVSHACPKSLPGVQHPVKLSASRPIPELFKCMHKLSMQGGLVAIHAQRACPPQWVHT